MADCAAPKVHVSSGEDGGGLIYVQALVRSCAVAFLPTPGPRNTPPPNPVTFRVASLAGGQMQSSPRHIPCAGWPTIPSELCMHQGTTMLTRIIFIC